MQPRLLFATFLVSALAACGGGGGGGNSTPAAPQSVADVTPAATMEWKTAVTGKQLTVHVQNDQGQPAVKAVVSVHTASVTTSPQDGRVLDKADWVAGGLLDTLVTDANGNATLALQLPAHVSQLVVAANSEGLKASRGVNLAVPAELNVSLTLAP
jgi:hypothetical protein